MKRLRVGLMVLLCLAPLLAMAESAGGRLGFERSAYTVEVGKTVAPKVVAQGIEGKLKYEWVSSNPEVATVSKGRVRGIASGETVIICRTTDPHGVEYQAECTVQVHVLIRKMTVDEKEIALAGTPVYDPTRTNAYFYDNNVPIIPNRYSQYKPTLHIYPEHATNQEIRWTSSDSKVARVSEDGVITGIFAGSATVTGTTTDGTEKSVKIDVEVLTLAALNDPITITGPEGVIIDYKRTSATAPVDSSFICVEGDCFKYYKIEADQEPMPLEGSIHREKGLDYLRLVPLKPGKGKLIFDSKTGAGRYKINRITVEVTVEPSAVRADKTHPIFNAGRAEKDPDAWIGQQVRFSGPFEKAPGKATLDNGATAPVYFTQDRKGNRTYLALSETLSVLCGEETPFYTSEFISKMKERTLERKNPAESSYVSYYEDAAGSGIFYHIFFTGNQHSRTLYTTVVSFCEYESETGLIYRIPYCELGLVVQRWHRDD